MKQTAVEYLLDNLYLRDTLKWKVAYNGSRLGEVGDFENETLKLLVNLN
jgi:hypothetical protein